jgi:hypothetical protein
VQTDLRRYGVRYIADTLEQNTEDTGSKKN